MAKTGSRLLTLLFLASILVFSFTVPVLRAEEVEEESSFSEDAAKEIVQTATEETEAAPEEEKITLRSSPGVEIAVVFPKHDVKLPVIPAGSSADIVVGILNGGESDVSVLSLDVKIVHPLDYQVVIQNFTVQRFEALVPPGAQASFPISFTPDKNFQPRDFGLTGIILYEVSGEGFGSAFYNGTIEIIEPLGYVSGESIFLVLLGLALLGLFITWASSQLKAFSKKSKKAKKTDSGEAEGESKEENEWLQDTNYYSHLKRSLKTSRKSRNRD